VATQWYGWCDVDTTAYAAAYGRRISQVAAGGTARGLNCRHEAAASQTRPLMSATAAQRLR